MPFTSIQHARREGARKTIGGAWLQCSERSRLRRRTGRGSRSGHSSNFNCRWQNIHSSLLRDGENPATAGDVHKPFSWDTAAIISAGETVTTGCEVTKVEMEKKQGEGPVERDKLQWSKALKEEVDSKQGESSALQDNLQGAGTALLAFQKRRREKFEEQRKELKSSKTKMEGCTDENVIVKREMQEMRVSSGTGLLNLETFTRCLEVSSNFDNVAKRQE